MPEVQCSVDQQANTPNSCIVEGVAFSMLNVECFAMLIPLDSTWLTLVPLDWHWFHLMTLDLTFHMLAMNDNCIQNSWLLIAKDFLIIFSLFLIFSPFYHFLSFFIILKHFYHFSGYHLYIQYPSKTNPSKSGYQDRCPDTCCPRLVCGCPRAKRTQLDLSAEVKDRKKKGWCCPRIVGMWFLRCPRSVRVKIKFDSHFGAFC